MHKYLYELYPKFYGDIVLYSRCFDDPHKCGDLVPGRVLSSRYKWGTVIKAVMSGGR